MDVDQKALIDGTYGDGLTVTSAMKGLAPTVDKMLGEILAGNFANYGGKAEFLGVEPDANYVELAPSTEFSDSFTQEDYANVVGKIYSGEIVVSDAIDAMPATSITVNDLGTVK